MKIKFSFEKNRIWGFAIAMIFTAALVLLDQVTKFIAITNLEENVPVVLIEGFFRFRLIFNPGAAFGSMQDTRWIFMSFSCVAIIVMLAYLFYAYFASNQPKLYTFSIATVLSGGIGNMIDRIFVGEVVDFFDFYFIDFAVFNVADSCVCIGAGLLILALILDTIKESNRQREKKNEGKS